MARRPGMPSSDHPTARSKHNLPFILLAALLIILWIAGGASRADVIGQVVTRGAAWGIAIIFILFAARPQWRSIAPVALFLTAIVLLVAFQLLPLPPSLWLELPGRGLLAEAAAASGQEQPWRPLSISPEATVNALSSLIVPAVALVLAAGLQRTDHWRVVTVMLGLIVAATILALLQFSGAHFDNPLINDVPGAVSGSFANRNHLALFVAIGCLLAPVWAFRDERQSRWKALAALALLLFFALIILATGSRTGMLLGALGIAIGLLIVWRRITGELKRLPKKIAIPMVLAFAGLLAIAIILSVTLDRAVSVERALSLEAGVDLRSQTRPIVLDMIGGYFPAGSGYGAFDSAFRIHEPSALLGPSYFNHAHNDLLEVVLDGGLPGLLLLVAAGGWWLWKSIQAWSTIKECEKALLAKLGSAIVLLGIVASTWDYPARTPIIMTVVMIAAIWLNEGGKKE